jgi:hypothetical protein
MANRIVAVDYGNHVRASNGKGDITEIPQYCTAASVPWYRETRRRQRKDFGPFSTDKRPAFRVSQLIYLSGSSKTRQSLLSFQHMRKISNSAHFQIYSMPIPEPIRNTWDDLSLLLYLIRGLTNEETFLAEPLTHLTFSLWNTLSSAPHIKRVGHRQRKARSSS